MTFTVEPDALTELAGDLSALDLSTGYGDMCLVKDARGYTIEHIDLSGRNVGQLLFLIAQQTTSLRDGINTALDRTSTALSASARELVKAAERYNRLDEDARRELDAAYPEWALSSGDYVLTVACPPSPLDALVDPPELIPTDWFSKILTNDWLSPSATVATVIDVIFDWNPFDEIAKIFVGNWDQLESIGGACEVLGTYFDRLTQAASLQAGECMLEWSGQAADAATEWFVKFAEFGAAAKDNCEELRNHYVAMSTTIAFLGGKLADLMAQIMDAILYAALLAAAAVVTVETVIGTIVFGVLAWLEASKAASLIRFAYETIMEAHDYVEGFVAVVNAATSALTTASFNVPVPGAYNHRQVF
jgi:hypothetical protein